MIESTDPAKERRQTRRAWLVVTGMVVLLLGGLIFVAFRDDSPPDDSWMLPHHRALQGENPLEVFCKFLEAHPIEGYRDRIAGDIQICDTATMNEFISRNASQVEALDRLMGSNATSWQWPGVNERVSVSTPTDFLWTGISTALHLQRVRVELKSRGKRPSEAADEALRTTRLGADLMDIEGCLIHWLVGMTYHRRGEDFLRAALTCTESNEDLLRHVQESLVPLEPTPRQMNRALQWDYLFEKNSEDNPHTADLLAYEVSSSDLFLIKHFCLPNRSRAIQLEMEGPLMKAGEQGWPEMVRANLDLKYQLQKWEDHWQFRINPNGGGNVSVLHSLTVFGKMIETAARNCALHRQTVLMIALRRFELRQGRLPQKLEELCPAYLPSVPLDPFDGAPMRWEPKSLAVYSIGPDLKDDHGAFSTPRNSLDKDVGMTYWWKPEPPKTPAAAPTVQRRAPPGP